MMWKQALVENHHEKLSNREEKPSWVVSDGLTDYSPPTPSERFRSK